MAEYISKQDVIDYLNGYLHSLGADDLMFDRGQRRALINAIQDISAVKSANVQPVKYGRWVLKENAILTNECTLCKRSVSMLESKFYKFCPYCGARMDLKDGDAE